MTAIGFLVFVVGWFIFQALGEPWHPVLRRYNRADYIGGFLIYAGAIVFLVGVVTWLWRVMP